MTDYVARCIYFLPIKCSVLHFCLDWWLFRRTSQASMIQNKS